MYNGKWPILCHIQILVVNRLEQPETSIIPRFDILCHAFPRRNVVLLAFCIGQSQDLCEKQNDNIRARAVISERKNGRKFKIFQIEAWWFASRHRHINVLSQRLPARRFSKTS